MRVSPSSRPCSAGDVMRVAGGRGMSERIRGRGLAGAGSRRSRSGVRSAGRARGSEWRTWTCLRRCLRPPGGGRCRLSAGGGPEGATEPFAATVSTNARHTGADSRVPGAAGGAELWHQDLSILLSENWGPEARLPQHGGNGCSHRACYFPKEGRVLWAGGVGTAPQRLWAEPLLVDGDRLSPPAVPWLRDEATKRAPRPHRCPDVVAPVTFLCPSPTAPRARSLPALRKS